MLELNGKRTTPPGGFQFRDPGSGMQFPLPGEVIYAWDALLDVVRKHRQASNGDLDIGWELRLEHEYCIQHPEAGCHHHVPSRDLDISLGDLKRFGYSVSKFIELGGDSVSQEEANRRAEICLQCPYRIQDAHCKSCNGLAQFFADAFFGKKTTPYDAQLGNCGVCKCYNKIAVHWPLEAQSMDGVSDEDFPDHCWKKHHHKETELD